MKTLYEEYGFKLPKNFKEEDLPYFKSHFDNKLLEPALIRFKKIIFFQSGVALKIINGKIIESNLPWRTWADSFPKFFWIKKIIKSLLTYSFTFQLKRVFIVTNPMSNNYFHWITEVVPKLLIILEKEKEVPIVISDEFKSEYQRTTFELLKIHPIKFQQNFVFLKEAILCSPLAEYPGYYSANTIRVVKNFFLSQIQAKSIPKFSPYIYISRKNAGRRKVINESDLYPILESYGIQILSFDDLSFEDIINASNNAKLMISIHGAGLTNMIFMPENSVVFEFLMEEVLVDKCYFILALASGHQYYYQTCKADAPEKGHVEANYWVDTGLFSGNLKLIMNSN